MRFVRNIYNKMNSVSSCGFYVSDFCFISFMSCSTSITGLATGWLISHQNLLFLYKYVLCALVPDI